MHRLSPLTDHDQTNLINKGRKNVSKKLAEKKREGEKALRRLYNNDDIVGHLSIPGTGIQYLVMKSADNSFYLSHDIEKQKSAAGWIFMDYENDLYQDDKNIIIYGHNMKQPIMFHELREYQSERFFLDHPYIYFNHLYENTEWEIFSFYSAGIDFNYNQIKYASDEDFYKLALDMNRFSLYDTKVDIGPEDRILTLSTCTGVNSRTRFVLEAKLTNKQ